MGEDFVHQPVLQREALAALTGGNGRRFLDGTLGGGGDTAALLEAFPEAEVLGIDRDPSALRAASERLEPYGERFHAWHGTFSQMERALDEHGWPMVDGVLLDIGVSSPQIDTPERGFSFRFDAPLDMRMDPSTGATAADLLNKLSAEELADIFWKFGEERFSRQVARAVVARRQQRPWERTKELADLLERVIGHSHQHGLPPPTRVFQALRIAVNHELEELTAALKAAERRLTPGGRLVVISFHSLEDRIVKQFFQHAALSCVCPPGMPCTCHKQVTLQILTRKPITATAVELSVNSRSGCAKLRCAERTAAPSEWLAGS
ncbi:MAG: 16S rRNA (cytosine(1402)-N(4))-methyltransferase RsmH [Victivallales bacterium]|nr:16S rRNA (cytosine(1402)-N(4))-methyltransferase RsmH [Victivallales bacterium]